MLKKLGFPMLLLSAMLLLSPQAASARWRVRVYGGVTPTYTYPVPYGYGYGYAYPYYYSTPMFPYGSYYYGGPSYHEHWRHEWREHHRR